MAYTLSVRLTTLVNPLACFLVLFLPIKNVYYVSSLVAVGSTLSGYLIYLATASPNPPLQHESMGVLLVVSCVISVNDHSLSMFTEILLLFFRFPVQF